MTSNKTIFSFIPWTLNSLMHSLYVSAGSVTDKGSIINVLQS